MNRATMDILNHLKSDGFASIGFFECVATSLPSTHARDANACRDENLHRAPR